MQELFRFCVDLAVVNLVERDAMTAKDFVRTESYALRLRPTGARKMTEEVNAWFNKTARVSGQRADVELCNDAEGRYRTLAGFTFFATLLAPCCICHYLLQSVVHVANEGAPVGEYEQLGLAGIEGSGGQVKSGIISGLRNV